MSAEPASGLVVVDKPAGLTSHDVVARVRRLAGTRKVGHAGTLDPMATGVLLVGVGRVTRLLGHLMLTDKAYDAVVRLGASTSTDDAEGDILVATSTAGVTDEQARDAFAALVGTIEQVPSAVSAIKVDGRRAYERVRAGETVTLSPRTVTVHEISVGRVERHADFLDVTVSVRCSSGTYIRAIARDVGAALGVGGHLTMLRRTAVGPFEVEQAHTLDMLAERFEPLPIAEVARRCFRSLEVSEEDAASVRVGRRLPLAVGVDGPAALFDAAGEFLALYEQKGQTAAAVAVFTG